MNLIQGSGGGRRKRSAPRPQPPVHQTVVVQQRIVVPTVKDDANSLFSKSSVRIVDLLSEGEIEGFVEDDEQKSIFFDETVIRNDDGTDNFVYDELEFRTGLGPSEQDYISGFSSSESVTQVNGTVGDDVGDSHVATVTDTDTDAIIVQILFPQLFVVSNGLKATSLKYLIEVQPSGGVYETKIEATASGKCTSPYERSHRISLDGDGPWNVRLKRVEGINDDDTNRRKLQFSSFTSIIEGKLRYPHSAVVGLRFDASQFQNIPTRSYDIKGIKVQIPSNATVDPENGSLSYTGVWDGQFQIAWCADPAWIMRDLITSTRYGLGRFVSISEVDKWSLYAISKYCNELVNDGEGGQEPRFLCNVYMQSRDDAFSVVQDFASVFRGMAYWSAGQIAFSQDRPSDAAALFSNSNVINGDFVYEGSSLKSRHTVALVTWNDPQNAFEQRVEYVSDDDAVAKYGVIETQVAAFGCTSRGQANRVGRWLLYSEQNETQTCTFSVGLDGAIVRPGQIIKVADQMRAGAKKGGRIASATTTQLVVDNSIPLTPGDSVSVVMPDGRVEQRTVQSGNFDRKEIVVSTPFSEAPRPQTVYIYEATSVVAQTFRVISVNEKDGEFQITALEHNDTKYDFVEKDLALQPRDITILDQVPPSPTSISIDERLVEINNAVTNEIEIAWRNVPNATGYRVSLKTDNTLSFVTLADTPYNNFTFTSDEIGVFTFRVSAISAIGKQSDPAVVSKSIAGLSRAPSDVQGFSMIPVNGQARLTWERSSDLDVRVGGHVLIRHTPDLSGATWANSISISKEIAGGATEAYCDLKEGTYLIKFVDSSGRLSLGTALIEFLKPDLQNLQNISTQTEHPSFTGTKTNLIVDTNTNELMTSRNDAAGGRTFLQENESAILQENDDDLKTEGVTQFETSATYEFSGNPITLSDVFNVSLNSEIKVRGFRPDDIKLDEVADFDAVLNVDGSVPLDANAQLYIRTTQDDPSGSPTYTSWREFNNAEFKARAFELKLEVETTSGFDRVAVSELEVTANLPVYSQTGTITTSASADVSQSYANKFYLTPQVGIAFTTQDSGDYYVISNSAATGFDISVYNSSDTRVARQVSWTATGYGKG